MQYIDRQTAQITSDNGVHPWPDGTSTRGKLSDLPVDVLVARGMYRIVAVQSAEPAADVYDDAAGTCTRTEVVAPYVEPQPEPPYRSVITMPAPYYDTHAAAELHALPRHVARDGVWAPVDPANPEAVGILRLVKATPPEGHVVVASHGVVLLDPWGEPQAWIEVIDATKSLAEVEAEERAAAKAEASRKADLQDAQAQYAAYCQLIGFPAPVDLDDLAARIEQVGVADIEQATRLGLTLNGLVARMQRLARDPAALDLILPPPAN